MEKNVVKNQDTSNHSIDNGRERETAKSLSRCPSNPGGIGGGFPATSSQSLGVFIPEPRGTMKNCALFLRGLLLPARIGYPG